MRNTNLKTILKTISLKTLGLKTAGPENSRIRKHSDLKTIRALMHEFLRGQRIKGADQPRLSKVDVRVYGRQRRADVSGTHNLHYSDRKSVV